MNGPTEKELAENIIISPEQAEAMEFQKKSSFAELKVRKCHIIINALAIGGEHVSPLFTSPQRKELQDKLATILKSL
jgi:hypothetical protein